MNQVVAYIIGVFEPNLYCLVMDLSNQYESLLTMLIMYFGCASCISLCYQLEQSKNFVLRKKKVSGIS
jgi:cyanate permease